VREAEPSYGETLERCRRLVGALRGLGLQTGDRVAIVGPNCHRYLELYQAVPGAGMVIVPLNQRHTDAELGYALADSGARVLFAGRELERIPDCVEHVFDLGDAYERLLNGAAPADLPDGISEDAVAGLFYTGGTTGAAKGVMLTHRNLTANALHLQACWPFGPGTCWLIVAPLFHAAGSIAVLATVWNAGRQVVLPAFDPAAALDLIERERVTATLVVPTMLAALSEQQLARPRDASTLRLVNHGGAPIATHTLRRAHAAFPGAELLHIYGATETAPIATMPKRVELRTEPLPKSGAGKVLKRELRAPYWEGREAMVGGA
jgi:long-chain acyl-CoA synthetase